MWWCMCCEWVVTRNFSLLSLQFVLDMHALPFDRICWLALELEQEYHIIITTVIMTVYESYKWVKIYIQLINCTDGRTHACTAHKHSCASYHNFNLSNKFCFLLWNTQFLNFIEIFVFASNLAISTSIRWQWRIFAFIKIDFSLKSEF